MTVEEIVAKIMNSNKEELERVRKAIKMRYGQIEEKQSLDFSIGDEVSFNSKKGDIKGKIIKINKKTIQVRDNNSFAKWRVSPSLLTKI